MHINLFHHYDELKILDLNIIFPVYYFLSHLTIRKFLKAPRQPDRNTLAKKHPTRISSY